MKIISHAVTLPEELISEVLSLLKVKSLLRFKCVNKSWNSLISDSFFIRMHLIKSSRNPHIILSPAYIPSNPNFSLHNPFLILSTLLQNPLFINLFPYDSKCKLVEKFCRIVGSCNGLTCLVSYPGETKFYLWNPAIRWVSQKLASFHHGRNTVFKFSFGYDNLTHKYKLVAFRPNEVRILALGDNVWRNIQSFPKDTPPHEYINNSIHENVGVYVNNTLNWFALRDNSRPNYYNHRYLSVQQFVIISLDLGIETYTHFLFPQGFDQVPVVPPIICVLLECLCFSHYSAGCNFIIWQMKEFGVQESLMKLLKFDYQSLLLHRSRSYEVLMLPLHVFENGDILILARNLNQLILYNSRENRVVRQAMVADSTCTRRFSVTHYVESLVSTY